MSVQRGNLVDSELGMDARFFSSIWGFAGTLGWCRHRNVAEFHSVDRRYRDLLEQCGMCIASKNLHTHYAVLNPPPVVPLMPHL